MMCGTYRFEQLPESVKMEIGTSKIPVSRDRTGSYPNWCVWYDSNCDDYLISLESTDDEDTTDSNYFRICNTTADEIIKSWNKENKPLNT